MIVVVRARIGRAAAIIHLNDREETWFAGRETWGVIPPVVSLQLDLGFPQ